MKYSILFFTCFWFHFALASNPVHDIHVSVTEIRWNPSSTSFEASIKLFIDDLESAMVKDNMPGLNIGTPKESANADQDIATYLEQHFHIVMDGITLPVEFVGKEITEDYKAVWCYVEFPGLKSPKQCSISNDLLFELYDDQRSIMDIRMSTTHKAYTIFEPGKSTWSYTF